MTQIRVRSTENAPATHVLAIGVGYYQYLLDGPQARKKVHLGLPVLNSPPVSAERFVRWFLGIDGLPGSGLNSPHAPLATVEVLISSRNPVSLEVNGKKYVVEGATLAAVQEGFDRWLTEVQSNPDNVGVIYFCGHGITGNGPEHYLLLEDHGAVPNRLFQTGSFDMTTTLFALSRSVPAQLYIFIDACRTFSDGLADTMGARPGPLLSTTDWTQTVNRGTTYINATGEGLPAYGDTENVARFTDALLRALNGYCGVPQPGTANWLVNGDALCRAVPKLLALVNKERDEGRTQSCSPTPWGQDVALHISTQPPKVKVEIDVSPAQYQTQGAYTMIDLLLQAPPLTGGGTKGAWQTEVVRGTYSIQVHSQAKAFQDFDSGVQYVDPPTFRLPVEVRP